MTKMPLRCAVLDDYQNVALKMADWSVLKPDVDVTVFNKSIGNADAVIAALKDFEIVCVMRERTPLPRKIIEALPKLKLIITTSGRNASIDMKAAAERGIPVCGTRAGPHHTAELAFGLILDLARSISFEDARMKAGEPWQTTIGLELHGSTLGILGLGKLGSRVAGFGRAFGMKVLAWSPNMTPEKAKEGGAEYATKEELLKQSDFVSIHLVLGDRSRGLIGAGEFALMKPTAYLVNTSRGPIVKEADLIAALRAKTIAGAGIDVYDTEPLSKDHPLRTLPNVVLTPHLGYVTEQMYRIFYGDTVEDIRAFVDGAPVRVIGA
ncbi:MAG: D-2-hydroxyacid dehydrogenase family protein [Rhizobiales bacterium]|nr:D-2-hydroxyacid dehydrogenase family protein [Hyphomicrobiales bacterium]